MCHFVYPGLPHLCSQPLLHLLLRERSVVPEGAYLKKWLQLMTSHPLAFLQIKFLKKEDLARFETSLASRVALGSSLDR